jgi:hypothetical protein
MVMSRVWTFKAVEDQMIEAMELWARSPGDKRWPFAGDGPWSLVVPDASDVGIAEHVLNAEAEGRPATEAPRRLPLTREEIRKRDRVSEWLRFAPEADRKLVGLVLARLALGRKPKWRTIRSQLIKAGEPAITARGLGMRYSRAITAIVKALNAAENRSGIVSTPVMLHA